MSSILVTIPLRILSFVYSTAPWWWWVLVTVAVVLYLRSGSDGTTKRETKSKIATRRRLASTPAAPPSAIRSTRPSLNAAVSRPQTAWPAPSPQLSRRNSAVWGPRGNVSVSGSMRGDSTDRGSPMRPSASVSNLRRMANESPARSEYSEQIYPSLAPPSTLPPLFPRSSSRPNLSRASSFASNSRAPSSLPFSRPIPAQRPTALQQTLKRGMDDSESEDFDQEYDERREGKRSKTALDLEEVAMELDDEVYVRRGTKRDSMGGEGDGRSKRSRRLSPTLTEAREEGRGKRRAMEDVEGSLADGEGKRSRSTRSIPASKRAASDVESSSDEGSVRVRNADSEDEEELDEVEEPREKSRGKRVKAIGGRYDTDDEDTMEGTFDDLSRPASPLSATKPYARRKAFSGGIKKRPDQSLALRSKKTPVKAVPVDGKAAREMGEEWRNSEGDRYKLGEDGVQRRACEVREWRKKYKMPKDSRHPDRDAMHEVVVEKWLTDAEFDAAFKERKLAWQGPLAVADEPETASEEVVEMDTSADVSTQPLRRENSLYFIKGSGAALRTTSNLYSASVSKTTSPSPASPAPPTPRSASFAKLANGRLRLPTGPSPAKGWVGGNVRKIIEDERRGLEEKERLRRGNEVEEPVMEKVVEKVVEKKKENEVEGGKLKLSDFGQKPVVAAVEPPALPPTPPMPTFFTMKPAAPVVPIIAPIPTPVPSKPSFFSNVTPIVPSTPSAPAAAPKDFFASASTPLPAAIVPTPSTTAAAATKSGLFNFGAAPAIISTPAVEKPAKIPVKPVSNSFFGNLSSASTPAASPTIPSTGGFSFGTPAVTPPVVPTPPIASASTPAPLFSFGAPAAPKPIVATNNFAFGATAAPSPIMAPTPSPFGEFGSAPVVATPATKAPFSFGAPTTAPASPALAPSGGSFAFGGAGGGSQAASGTTTPAGSFSFGAPASIPPPSTTAPFSFGTPAATASPAIGAGGGGFSFGNSTPSAPVAAQSSAPFSFGATPTTAPVVSMFGSSAASPAQAPFSFGAAPSSSAPSTFGGGSTGFGAGATSGSTTPFGAPSGGMTFGSTPTSLFGAPAAPAASSAPFAFGNTASAPSQGGGFSFGAQPIQFGGSAPAAAPGGFSFGATTGNGAPSFGSTAGSGTDGEGEGSVRRRAKRLPTRRS